MDSKKILEKLFAIAKNQQQMIVKLAQGQSDAAYIKQVAQTAAMNLNTGLPITIDVSAGASQPSSDPSVQVSPNFVVRVGGLKDEKQKAAFKANFDRTLDAQAQTRPLNAGVTVIFS